VVLWTLVLCLGLTIYGIAADISDFIELGHW
jgi:hypothetical protein